MVTPAFNITIFWSPFSTEDGCGSVGEWWVSEGEWCISEVYRRTGISICVCPSLEHIDSWFTREYSPRLGRSSGLSHTTGWFYSDDVRWTFSHYNNDVDVTTDILFSWPTVPSSRFRPDKSLYRSPRGRGCDGHTQSFRSSLSTNSVPVHQSVPETTGSSVHVDHLVSTLGQKSHWCHWQSRHFPNWQHGSEYEVNTWF
jgi:hypothetical protein